MIEAVRDNRDRLRQAFELPGAGEDPVDYDAEVGELRLVVVDSNVPGQDPGAFDPEQLSNPDKIFPTPRLCGEKPGPYQPHPLEVAGVAELF